ncbi:MAG: L,D-transpeptidase [Myxococcota bacterium]|nr:L,D-transpeptidase family protein [Myxococcota bacterium]
MDKSLKKTGHSIWIHGFPLNGDRSKDRSEGCVVMPYPNSIGQTLFIVRFRQAYKLKAHVFKRTKELYIRKQNRRFSIVLEH